MSGVIVLGSARKDGHTRSMVQYLSEQTGMQVLDLNDYDIGFFEYDNYDRGDDFLPLIEDIIRHDLVVLATPVYWYSMSAVMKNFFDRITDLLRHHKDHGRAFRSKSMALLSCSATQGDDPEFSSPFRKTAEYLGMQFVGHQATWTYDKEVSDETKRNLRSLLVFCQNTPESWSSDVTMSTNQCGQKAFQWRMP